MTIVVTVRFQITTTHEQWRNLALPVVPMIGDDLEIDGVRWVVYDRVIRADIGTEASVTIHVGRRIDVSADDEAGDPELDLPPVFGGGEGQPS